MNRRKKILILGATGMLGHALFRLLAQDAQLDVSATARTDSELDKWFPADLLKKIIIGVHADKFDTVVRELENMQPDIVINCIGLIKQQPITRDPLAAININAQMPHRIALVCRSIEARLIHMSTDCVFNGKRGKYKESDVSDAEDLYGRTKYLGELNYRNCITLRTSIIGHELKGHYGLIEWFLAQNEKVRGFRKAIFSGFPTVELVRIIHDFILPNPELSGVCHISAEPISKYDLLRKVAQKYNRNIEIEPDDAFIVDRSLDSTIFREATHYSPPSWDKLIEMMHSDFILNRRFYTAE
jgi:dTDP-4-dehydrorhamnose reductase